MNQTEQSMIFGYLASAILVRPSDHVCPTPYLLGTFLGAKIGARLVAEFKPSSYVAAQLSTC